MEHNRKRTIVITGLGIKCPIGLDIDEFWSNALSGVVGIGPIQSFDPLNMKVRIAGEVKGFDPVSVFGYKASGRMDRFVQLGLSAAMDAFSDAGLDAGLIDPDRLGVVAGSAVGGSCTTLEETLNLSKGPSHVSPLLIPKSLPNILSGSVAIQLGARAFADATVTACAAGSDAIGKAYRHILAGDADIVLAGASESCINPLMIAGFTNLKALCESNEPARSSIPFDKERSGFVLGEGAGFLVLETLEHALERGARIYCEMAGYGFSCDAYHLVTPVSSGAGDGSAMRKALKSAGAHPSDIGYINAHGTSTQLNDAMETRAIKDVFGKFAPGIPISSTKSMTGHLQGAAGAVEGIATAMALFTGFAHPTAGLMTDDPECDLDYVKNSRRRLSGSFALSNSFGFGGHNSCIVLKEWNK